MNFRPEKVETIPAAAAAQSERRTGGDCGRSRSANPLCRTPGKFAAACVANSLFQTLSVACGFGLGGLDPCGNHHSDRADRGSPHDRFRFLAARPSADRQLFSGHDRRRRRARDDERAPLLPRHHTRRAYRCRFARRRVRPHHLVVGGFFRRGQDRRIDLAVHRRYDTNQSGRRQFGLGGVAEFRTVYRRQRHDGGEQSAAFGVRARGHPDHRAAALCLRPRGAAALAFRARHVGRCLGLCRRTHLGGARTASFYQRAARRRALSRRDRARLCRGARFDQSAGRSHRPSPFSSSPRA